ncbi:MAG: hypothetical protein ACLQFM_19950 [Terriglobales bacterium]|jgi:hypothetical protein
MGSVEYADGSSLFAVRGSAPAYGIEPAGRTWWFAGMKGVRKGRWSFVVRRWQSHILLAADMNLSDLPATND